MTLKTTGACALILAAVIAANLISAHYGPSASIYNAFFLVGLALTFKDFLYDAWGKHRVRNTAILIAAGSVLSYACAHWFSDAPYGIGWVPRVNHRGADQIWVDDKQFDPRPFMTAKQHVFWGGNYFAHLLPPTESWFVWMKRPTAHQSNFENDRRSYAMAEMAWSDIGTKPLVKVHVWDGGMRAGRAENRFFCHPSQKPVEVMTWCLTETTGLIIDPFMGSGTTLRAAKDLGRRAIGIEIEERYCEIAAERMAQEVLFGEAA